MYVPKVVYLMNTLYLNRNIFGWLPWPSVGSLKLVFNASSDDQGNHRSISASYLASSFTSAKTAINCCMLIFFFQKRDEYSYMTLFVVFNPRPLRPQGYCRHLRLSVCLSVRLPVCLSVPVILVNTITQSVYPINPPNLLGVFNMALSWMAL